jgi:hypothetical protein
LGSKIAKVTDGFVKQLARAAYVDIEGGILNITDQILIAVDQDDSPDNVGSEDEMERIPALLAKSRSGRE